MDLRPFMERWHMLPPSGGVMLVAVSGGRDSVCLLHYLAAMPRDFTVAAAHLDHGQRPTAGRDVAFVEELCRSLDVPLTVERADVPALARERGVGLEEAGRMARYDFFRRTADRLGAQRIATAHHAADQAETVLLASMQLTRQLAADGVKAFGVGELGMANTTPAAATISVLTGSDPDAVVGCGANLPLAQRGHKVAVVRQAIAHNQPNPADGLDVLAKVGGYDLVGMTGVILGAASCGLPVVLDGFLSYASALAACRMAPSAHPYLIPSHLSAEKGAQIALDALGLRPYLDMDMRLGEGSGAALAMHLLDAASVMYNQMGTLAQSNIVLPDSAPSS